MADQQRARRIAGRIKVIVASMLETRIKDPRLGFVTVTDARVTGDLQHATVFYTVYGNEEERADTAAALTSATGVIRSEVGKKLGIRLTPTLTFVADAIPEEAAALEAKLREVRERDAEIAAAREGAVPAGDADPYRRPRVEDDEEDDSDDDILEPAESPALHWDDSEDDEADDDEDDLDDPDDPEDDE